MSSSTHLGSPAEELQKLLGGKWVSQAISAAAYLALADIVVERGPTGLAQLAESSQAQPELLERLLALLVGFGIFCQDTSSNYTLTDMGRELTSDRLGPLAKFMGSSAQWNPWALLPETLRSGKSAFELYHGMGLYEWLQDHPEDAKLYDRGVDVFTQDQAQALADSYDFSEARKIVDVGGGKGTLLLRILKRWQHLQGVLFDLPHVTQETEAEIVKAELKERCQTQAGSFFEALPGDADVYILKHVLHNWGDDEALQILKNCRKYMPEGSSLLMVETLVLPGLGKDAARLLDMEMMALFASGKERSKKQLKELLEKAGFRMDRQTSPLANFARLIVAYPVS